MAKKVYLGMIADIMHPGLINIINEGAKYGDVCDVIINPTRPLTNYKLLDDIMLELAGKLKIQQLQDILAEK